jgi:recombination protein RecT
VSNGGAELAAGNTLTGLLSRIDVKKRFEEILGKKAAGFMSSILSLTNADNNLKTCEPKTILSSAMMAATLDLPVNKNLGFAWIIPYKNKAEFQMGYKGFVQLGIRTGQYKTMNASEIYEDEIKVWNPITGEIEFTDPTTWKFRAEGKDDKILGYVAFFKLINGFEKYLYMTVGQVDRHARRYAQSYGNQYGKWKTDFGAMAKKTVLKLLLSKYGILSIEMQRALVADQGVVVDAGRADETPEVEFLDAQVVNDDAAGTAIEPE